MGYETMKPPFNANRLIKGLGESLSLFSIKLFGTIPAARKSAYPSPERVKNSKFISWNIFFMHKHLLNQTFFYCSQVHPF